MKFYGFPKKARKLSQMSYTVHIVKDKLFILNNIYRMKGQRYHMTLTFL